MLSQAEEIKHAVTIGSSPNSPPGRAAYFVQDPKGPTLAVKDSDRNPVRRMELALPFPTDPESGKPSTIIKREYFLTPADLDNRPALDGVALFRGHRYAGRFHANPTTGAEVIYQAPPYLDPMITASGKARKRGSVIFVLDCSWTMNEPANRLEAAGDAGKGPRRIDVAKQALKAMLTQLGAQGDHDVGIRFFGHRRARNLDSPDEILDQSNYGREIPQDVLPSEDVEEIIPLGRFTRPQANAAIGLLETVKGWGETPLFLSLLLSLGDFPPDQDAVQSIVVITDGKNYQFNSPDPTTRNAVLSALDKRNVPVNIIGFETPAEERAETLREWNAIASQSGGKVYEVHDATTLIRTLREALGPN
ncbi:MAG: VWA domain-containing protein, partial [Planctomycetales bacterium]